VAVVPDTKLRIFAVGLFIIGVAEGGMELTLKSETGFDLLALISDRQIVEAALWTAEHQYHGAAGTDPDATRQDF
jgi:hypothetical protein